MKKVRVLKNMGQVNRLRNKEHRKGINFNPIQDADGDWIISEEEVDSYFEHSDRVKRKPLSFINKLPQKDHNPVVITP